MRKLIGTLSRVASKVVVAGRSLSYEKLPRILKPISPLGKASLQLLRREVLRSPQGRQGRSGSVAGPLRKEKRESWFSFNALNRGILYVLRSVCVLGLLPTAVLFLLL